MIFELLIPNRNTKGPVSKGRGFFVRKQRQDAEFVEVAIVCDEFGSVIQNGGLETVLYLQEQPEYLYTGQFLLNGVMYHKFELQPL